MNDHRPTTRKMSDRHEAHVAEVLEGTRTKNSGAVWNDQSDGHHLNSEEHWRFGWDGKATLGKSIGVSREMWAKIGQQARGLHPLIPLRFYNDTRLTQVEADLVCLDLTTFAEILDDANAYRRQQQDLSRLDMNSREDRQAVLDEMVGRLGPLEIPLEEERG